VFGGLVGRATGVRYDPAARIVGGVLAVNAARVWSSRVWKGQLGDGDVLSGPGESECTDVQRSASGIDSR
jgi:hypothetical protein